MRLLGIDPGTKCGYAILDGGRITSGVWDLSSRRHEGGGMRYLRLKTYLEELLRSGVDVVAYEEVHRHLGTDAAHVYGGIVATIATACEAWEVGRIKKPIPYRGIPVGTVKKFATGKGNANKDAMIAAATSRWPSETMADDNEADARFIVLVLARDLHEGVDL